MGIYIWMVTTSMFFLGDFMGNIILNKPTMTDDGLYNPQNW